MRPLAPLPFLPFSDLPAIKTNLLENDTALSETETSCLLGSSPGTRTKVKAMPREAISKEKSYKAYDTNFPSQINY